MPAPTTTKLPKELSRSGSVRSFFLWVFLVSVGKQDSTGGGGAERLSLATRVKVRESQQASFPDTHVLFLALKKTTYSHASSISAFSATCRFVN